MLLTRGELQNRNIKSKGTFLGSSVPIKLEMQKERNGVSYETGETLLPLSKKSNLKHATCKLHNKIK
jgi:hypothetical protein